MTCFLINVPPSTGQGFKFKTSLSGFQFRFIFSFNVRDGFWSFDIFDGKNALIFAGVRVQVGIPALAWLTDPRQPAGRLCFVDTSGQKRDPGQNDLGGRVLIAYDDLIEAA